MEVLEVFDNLGKPTGKKVMRGAPDSAYQEGEQIGVAIIYIENNEGKFLIQKTAKDSDSMYSSTGGHINYHEKPIDAIIRETKEELGLNIKKEDITELGFIHSDFPIRFIYYLKKDVDINNLKLQKEEVASVSYMSIEEINELTKKGLMNKGHTMGLQKVIEYKKGKTYEK